MRGAALHCQASQARCAVHCAGLSLERVTQKQNLKLIIFMFYLFCFGVSPKKYYGWPLATMPVNTAVTGFERNCVYLWSR